MQVGRHVRAAGYGFSVQASVAYAYVQPPDGRHGEEMVSLESLREGAFEIETYEHGRVPARFHAKPPFDPAGKRIRGEYG